MATEVRGGQQLRDLSLRLREMGSEGKGLQRELYRAINDAAKPLSEEIRVVEHLRQYMPARYAGVLASDLTVTATKRGGQRASVAIRAKGRVHKRAVQTLNAGLLRHPVFARDGVPRRDWHWVTQRAGVRRGFFTDPVRRAAPGIRDQVQQAMHDVAQKITA